jgi:hypothetical protein
LKHGQAAWGRIDVSTDEIAPLMTAHASEYSAIRAEICAFHTVEGQVMSITIGFMGVLAGLIGFGDYINFIHLIPIPFVALGIIFAYTQARIIQAATYLHKQLRPAVEAMLGSLAGREYGLWRWEIFRRSEQCPVRILSTWLNSARWLFFIAPALFPLTVWKRDFRDVGDVLLLIWDLILPLFLMVIAVWSSALLPSRVLR